MFSQGAIPDTRMPAPRPLARPARLDPAVPAPEYGHNGAPGKPAPGSIGAAGTDRALGNATAQGSPSERTPVNVVHTIQTELSTRLPSGSTLGLQRTGPITHCQPGATAQPRTSRACRHESQRRAGAHGHPLPGKAELGGYVNPDRRQARPVAYGVLWVFPAWKVPITACVFTVPATVP